MPRPCKRRRICSLPGCRRFGDLDRKTASVQIVMTLDEFEAVRLIDLEGLSQQECAQQMEVARATVQSIYAAARKKLAQCLVQGCELAIEGGDYVLCDGDFNRCACGHGRCRHEKRQILVKEKQNVGASCGAESPAGAPIPTGEREKISSMRIAVTYEDGQIFQHFGHTEQFQIYEVENGTVKEAQTVSAAGSGHGALAGFLKQHGVEILICGGIGGGARTALSQAGIQLFGGVSGSADQAVADFLAGTLSFQPDVTCRHHEEQHGSCGSSGCGNHGHDCGGSCHGH